MADDDYATGEGAVAAALDAQLGGDPRRGGVLSPKDRRDGKRLTPDGAGVISRGAPMIRALPDGAPVAALGTYGNRCYFLDSHAQLRELGAKDVNRTMILHLFGTETQAIYDLWPVTQKRGEEYVVTGWDGTKAQESLMRACAAKGIWRPQDHVRGRGAWREGDRLMIHSGHRLFVSDGTWQRPGLIGATVYPAGVRSLEPAPVDPDHVAGDAAADKVLELLRTWCWKRPFDPMLLLGWVAAAMIAGALKVRPLAWVTGEKGTGKSSLVGEGGIVHRLFGAGILMTANTTAAGLYQKIEFDSLPVAIDEIEAKRGNQKTEAVIELARQAYSGGMVLRGGADHEGREFRAMCPVLFGSILIPPLMPQDLSRLALLNLEPFAEGTKEPDLESLPIETWGRAMLRRWLDRWPEWPARRALWHDHLRGMGHSGRASDQFGTLLAAADLMLHDKMPDADWMGRVAGGMAPADLQETQVESSNAARCIGYAMSRPIHAARGGEQLMVSELITCAVRRAGGDMETPIKPLDAVRYLERAGVSVLAMTQLPGADGKMLFRKPAKVAPQDLDRLLDGGAIPAGVYVAFSPDGDGILELFRGSDWEGVAGAHNPYTQALERVTGAWRGPQAVRLGGRVCKPILVPIDQCVDLPTAKEAQANDP